MSPIPLSKYDQSFIARDTHDEFGHFSRVSDANSVASKYFTHFRATYNSSGAPVTVSYFRGTAPQKTHVGAIADVSGSLAGKHVAFSSAPDNKRYYVYFTVNGVGTNPNLANATGFAADIQPNDAASVVALAFHQVVNSNLSAKFISQRTSAVVQLSTVELGTANISTTNAGFVLTNTAGTQELTNSITIEYDSASNPIYQGQPLKNMYYNIFSGKFEKDVTASNYELQDFDEASSSLLYEGNMSPEGKYMIKRTAITGTSIQIRYANLSNNSTETTYQNAWGNRASLAFTYLNQLSDV